MVLEFTKMNGAGNDFVLVDNRAQTVRLTRDQIVRVCHRQRGVGADGLILLVPSASGKTPWAWDFYNCDGSMGEMCGNGARCFARFVQKHAGSNGDLSFETRAGIIHATFHGAQVTVGLTRPEHLKLHEQIRLSEGWQTVHTIDTGVPHAVLFVMEANDSMVQMLGPQIRHHPHFSPRGTNVNFVQVLGHDHILVRTFERGVEAETLACGTGVTASALIASLIHKFNSPIKIRVHGGDELEVSFKENNGAFEEVSLTGPAEFVFEGEVEI
ncbi:Diaminopimelate epimerase [Verrucomicrobia bacterium]|nr:Diaminopimelate epimerase [Verrucomicrobiota bacterium]